MKNIYIQKIMNLMPKSVKKALKMLNTAGFDAFAVGGCIRDCLLNKTPSDWDITTSAKPHETKKIFKNYQSFDSGISHGTITVIIDGISLEITTFRFDGNYKDFRHPTSVEFSKHIEDDLARRDFTINAMCCDIKGNFIDLFDGINDLNNKMIRCVGNTNKRFDEDALRILRAIRFSSTLHFTLSKDTKNSVLLKKENLQYIAKERIKTEFIKLINGCNAAEVIREYHSIIEIFIPELKNLIKCPQNTKYHKFDVFEHTLAALNAVNKENSGEYYTEMRLSMFFHDFGKPQARTTDKNGTDHFKGHAEISSELTKKILTRLKFSNKEIKQITLNVYLHDTKAPKNKIEAKKLLSKYGEDEYKKIIIMKRTDNDGKAFPHAIDEKLSLMKKFYEEIKYNNECYSTKELNIDGNDIILNGLGKNKVIGKELSFLLDAVIEEKCNNKKTELLKYLKENF